MSDAVRDAERALFSSRPAVAATAKASPVEASRRILPSLVKVATPTDVEVEPPRRRGRKPGSKNRPKPDRIALLEPAGRIPARPALSDDVLAILAASGSPASQAAAGPEAQARAKGIEAPSVPTQRDRPRLRERSSILARYVHETEPVPGERWKRKARRTERRHRPSA